MRKIFYLFLILAVFLNTSGCIGVFIVGSAAGALGAYAVNKDTIQGETDKSYHGLWHAAITVGRIRGTVRQEDSQRGYIELDADSSRIFIRLIRLTSTTTRVRVSCRKYHLPNLSLAEEIFVKIMEQVR